MQFAREAELPDPDQFEVTENRQGILSRARYFWGAFTFQVEVLFSGRWSRLQVTASTAWILQSQLQETPPVGYYETLTTSDLLMSLAPAVRAQYDKTKKAIDAVQSEAA